MRSSAVVTIGFASLIVASVATSPSGAAPPPEDEDPWTARPFALEAQVGVGAPHGAAGAAVEWAPTRWLVVGAGTGVAFSGLLLGQTWVQEALAIRLRRCLGTVGLSGGLGWSTGPYAWFYDGSRAPEGWKASQSILREWRRAHWVNLEVAVEHRRPSGLQLRALLGLGAVMNPAAGVCRYYTGDTCDALDAALADGKGEGTPYFALAVGYGFGP